MPDDVILNKAEIIERCIVRVKETYGRDPAARDSDSTIIARSISTS